MCLEQCGQGASTRMWRVSGSRPPLPSHLRRPGCAGGAAPGGGGRFSAGDYGGGGGSDAHGRGDKAPPPENPRHGWDLGRERDATWNGVWSRGLLGKKTWAKLVFFSSKG